MSKLIAATLCLAGCAPLDGIAEKMDISGRAERIGTALRLNDGRLVGVRVINAPNIGVGVTCGKFVSPDYIYLVADPKSCPRLELLLLHELGHAYGMPHTQTGVMAALPGEMADIGNEQTLRP